jgi:hypothetical protein
MRRSSAAPLQDGARTRGERRDALMEQSQEWLCHGAGWGEVTVEKKVGRGATFLGDVGWGAGDGSEGRLVCPAMDPATLIGVKRLRA